MAAEAKSLTPKGFKTVMDIDAQGTFNMCSAVYPAMAKRNGGGGRGGTIINISMTLHYGATWYQAHASAAKSAIDSLTRTLALEWGCDGIRVNGIAPGPIADTPGTTTLAPGRTADDIEEMIAERVPLERRKFKRGASTRDWLANRNVFVGPWKQRHLEVSAFIRPADETGSPIPHQ